MLRNAFINGLRSGDNIEVEFKGKWQKGRILFDGCQWYIDAEDNNGVRINILGTDIEQLRVKVDF